MNLGESIVAGRKASRLSQQKLADQIGVHVMTISRWELGKFEPDFHQLKQLVNVLGLDLIDIFGSQDSPIETPLAIAAHPLIPDIEVVQLQLQQIMADLCRNDLEENLRRSLVLKQFEVVKLRIETLEQQLAEGEHEPDPA